MAAREHVDPHALDDHLDQRVVHRADYPTRAASVGPSGPTAGVAPNRVRDAHQPRTRRARRRPEREAADVGEERDAALGLGDAQRGEAVDQLEHEPEAEDDDRRHLDELVEEAEEHERRDARPREQHQVRAQHRRDRAGRADRRDGRGRVDRDLGERRPPRRRRGRTPGTSRARGGPRCCSRRSTGTAGCPAMCSQPPWRNWLVTSVAVSVDTQSPAAHAAVRSAGTTPQRVMNASSALSPVAREQGELPGEDEQAGARSGRG